MYDRQRSEREAGVREARRALASLRDLREPKVEDLHRLVVAPATREQDVVSEEL